MLVLGNAHASDLETKRVLAATCRAADADVALQAGSLGHYDLPVPTYFAAGGTEDLDVVDALRLGRVQSPTVSNVHLLASDAVELDGLRVGGLSGTYSESHYRRPRARLHREGRRHFTREDVERARELDVDVFLTHEPPAGVFDPDLTDAEGCRKVNEVLGATRPSICLVGGIGHHARESVGDTTLVSLAPVWQQYYTLDPGKLTLTRHEPPDE